MFAFSLAQTEKSSSPVLPAPCHVHNAMIPGGEGVHVILSASVPAKVESHAEDLSHTRKSALATLLILTNFVALISFGAGVGGGLHIASSLGVTDPSQASWIAASYPLTAGAFILMSGRLGSIYGHSRVLLLGASWWVVWSLISGFCNNFVAFNIARGMNGIGGAMVVPNAVAIIGTTIPPGKMRNRCLAFFGTGAPIGGWAGVLMAGLLAERIAFKWLFVFM